MSRPVRLRIQAIALLLMLLTTIVSLSLPAPMLRAQDQTPPPPPATSEPDARVLATRMGVASLGETPSTSSRSSDVDLAQRHPDQTTASAPAAPAVTPPTTEQPAPAAPQATALTPFLVNIVAKGSPRADVDLTYTIYFTNTGSTTYNNVLLQDGIGDGQFYRDCASTSSCVFTYTGDLALPTLVSVGGSPASSAARQIVWSLGTVTPGQKGRIVYTVRPRADLLPQSGYPPNSIGNTVALYRDGTFSSVTKLNEDQWSGLIVGPVFYMTKSVTPQRALEGDSISYTISIGNATGPSDQPNGQIRPDAVNAAQVKVVDIVPANLENVQPLDGGTYDAGTRWITWNLSGVLTPGATPRQLHFNATVRNDLALCDLVINEQFFVSNPDIPLAVNGGYLRGQIGATTFLYPPATVTVTPSPPGPFVGDNVAWTIDVKNYWRTAISPVSIVFNMPPAFTYQSSSPTGTYNAQAQTVTWSNLTLPAKQDFTSPGILQLTVQTKAGRVIGRNYATAQIVQPLPGGIPNGCLRAGVESADVQPLLYTVKTVDRSAVMSGNDVVYTVVLNNMSSQTMTGVSLVDTLPAFNYGVPYQYNFVFKSVVTGTPQPSSIGSVTPGVPQTVRWDGLTVPGGSVSSPGKTTLRFVVTANGRPFACGTNHVQADSSISQAWPVDQAQVCINPPWTVEKTVDRTSVNARDSNRLVHFVLRYDSYADTPQSFTARDHMVDYPVFTFGFKRMVAGPDGTIKPNPINLNPDQYGLLTWPQDTLPAHGTVYYAFEAELPADQNGVIPGGRHCNEGQFVPQPNDQYGYFIYTLNGACVNVSLIDLIATKIVNRGIVGLGEIVTYSILLENRSTVDAVTGLTISDTLPVNMTFVGPGDNSPSPQVTTLANGQQLLTWSGVVAPSNMTTVISFKARAPGLINQYKNTAQVSGGNPVPNLYCRDGSTLADGSCLTPNWLDVRSLIAIDTDVSPPTASPSGTVTYTLSLVSNNNIPYEDTTVTATLPLGFTYLDSVSGAPTETHGRVLIWRGQTVPPQSGPNAGKVSFIFHAQAPAGYGLFRTRVDATSPTGIIPTADNIAPVLIASPTPSLSLFATPLVQVGGDVLLKISLVNPELTDVTNVSVVNTLPDGFTFVGVDGGTPAPSVNGQVLTWSGLTMPAATDAGPGVVELVFHATAPQTIGTYQDTVTATGSRTIDQTYNSAQIIVAELSYVYLPLIAQN